MYFPKGIGWEPPVTGEGLDGDPTFQAKHNKVGWASREVGRTCCGLDCLLQRAGYVLGLTSVSID